MEQNKQDQIREDRGSRDLVREKLKKAQDLLYEASEEIAKLRTNNRSDLAYRYADADLGITIATLEKVRIVMRKRKKSDKSIEAKVKEGPAPQAPIGD